jgi:hypothetical protein
VTLKDIKDAVDELFIAAWRREEDLNTLAAELKLRPKTLVAHWRRLRASGKLPENERPLPPESKQHRQQRVDNPLYEYDGRPIVGDWEDPLLDKLMAEFPRRASRLSATIIRLL